MPTINNFSPLKKASHLHILELSNIVDITPLKQLAHLRFIRITSRAVINDFKTFSELSELQELIISITDSGTIDICPLSKIHTLRILDFSDCSSDLNIPHINILKTQIPHCQVFTPSEPNEIITRTFRAGIDGIFRKWITLEETMNAAK